MEKRNPILKLTTDSALEFSIEFVATSCQQRWPQVEISSPGARTVQRTVVERDIVTLTVPQCDGVSHITIKYVNKTEQDTRVHGDDIVEDQTLTLARVWCDDIVMENWFLTDGSYCPRYFPGFLQRCPQAAPTLPSQLIWHFPGEYRMAFRTPFWQWYAKERRDRVTLLNIDRDEERWENISGSQKRHVDLESDIWKLIHV
jgi:hypothetical protein